MTQAQLKACTAKVRRAAIGACDGQMRLVSDRGYICNNRVNHLNPMVTGFCHSGWHEGYKIDKPTCKHWVTCPCDCHTQLSRMAALTESERVLVDNSFWVPDRTGLVQVSLAESVIATVTAKSDARVVPSQAPGIAPDTIERVFSATTSGRLARGQLEAWVQQVTDVWVTERPENCTPQYVVARIMEMQAPDKEPSTGAIDAVFKRWAAIGYAMIGQKPTRFITYTPAGIREGLEVLKARAKR